jgi:hypothetical protein
MGVIAEKEAEDMNDPQCMMPAEPARLLIFSQRRIYRPEVWRCTFDEFERIIQRIESVDILAPVPRKSFQYRMRSAQRIGKILSVAINPGIPRVKLNRKYDVFLAVCEKPAELLNVGTLQGWKEQCKTSVCWLTEFWIKDIPFYRSALKILSKFDVVLLNVARTVEPLSHIIQKKCFFLPAGIDTLLFSPYPDPPGRFIDVLSIGRRSENTHRALLRMAEQNRIFYHFDTLRDLHANDNKEHRYLIASLAKRARYFIVNPGKIDSPDERASQVEFGYRYFEGAAAGAILIGDYPDSKEFRQYFPWRDNVIHLPYGSDEIARIIEEIDSQAEKQDRIRRMNVVQSLLNHDWVYRWETILDLIGLEPRPELLARKRHLRHIVDIIERG